MNTFQVRPIDPDRLDRMRANGADEHGNPFTSFAARGWEPLRCCLTIAAEGEGIALISYAPFTQVSPWTEAGPVYVHAERCEGHTTGELPEQLRVGPRILRSYSRDGRLDYGHVTLVPEGEDLEPALKELFDVPDVATVHVRALMTQCFTYAVERT